MKHVLPLVVAILLVSVARAETTTSQPFPGVTHIHRVERKPRPLNIHIVAIDLETPGLSFRVSPPDADPPVRNGVPDETITQTTRAYMQEQGAQIGVNASFFRLEHHSKQLWTNNLGLAVSDGVRFSPWDDRESFAAINISRDNKVTLLTAAPKHERKTGYESIPADVELYNAVTGNYILVRDGRNVAPRQRRDEGMLTMHPRTALGVTHDNHLLIITVDGRQPGFSEGMYLDELAELMLMYGCVQGVNLDGGGSTTLAMDFVGDDEGPVLVNSPVGRGPRGSERNNGTNLAVFLEPAE